MNKGETTVNKIEFSSAVHEAGHAVIARFYGIPVKRIKLTETSRKPDGGSAFGFIEIIQPEITIDNLGAFCTYLSGGLMAEIEIAEKHIPGGSTPDLYKAYQLCVKFGQHELASECEKRARALIVERKEQVWFLAYNLCVKRELSGKEIEQSLAED